jgi:hypothetical protein
VLTTQHCLTAKVGITLPAAQSVWFTCELKAMEFVLFVCLLLPGSLYVSGRPLFIVKYTGQEM